MDADDSLDLSVVVLAWDNLDLTRAFVDSVRRNTDVGYELIIVDNGSQSEAAAYARDAADHAILNDENRGFARDEPGARGGSRRPRRILQQRHRGPA